MKKKICLAFAWSLRGRFAKQNQKAHREAELAFANELSTISPSENAICNMKIYDYMQMWYAKK